MDDSIPMAVSMETYPVSRSQSIWSSPSPLRQHEIKRGIIYKWLERISGYSGEGPMTYLTPLPWEKVSSQQAGLTADLMKTGGCFAARTTFYMGLYTSVELQLMGQNSRGNTGSRSFESHTHTKCYTSVLKCFVPLFKQRIIMMQYTYPYAWNWNINAIKCLLSLYSHNKFSDANLSYFFL